MKFSITEPEKNDLLIQVTVHRGERIVRFDCI